jgi:hypothetical protein
MFQAISPETVRSIFFMIITEITYLTRLITQHIISEVAHFLSVKCFTEGKRRCISHRVCVVVTTARINISLGRSIQMGPGKHAENIASIKQMICVNVMNVNIFSHDDLLWG